LTDRLIGSAAVIVVSKLGEANWIFESDAPFFRVNHFIQMESDASKDNNNNLLLLLILPIYAAIVSVAIVIDFLLYRKAIRKK
jgi:hypothetical protein